MTDALELWHIDNLAKAWLLTRPRHRAWLVGGAKRPKAWLVGGVI